MCVFTTIFRTFIRLSFPAPKIAFCFEAKFSKIRISGNIKNNVLSYYFLYFSDSILKSKALIEK